MLARASVEKDSTSCETVLIKWKLNAKHKLPTFYHQNVAVSPSLFFLVNWSSSNQENRLHLSTWPNTGSVSNIKWQNLRFRTDLVNGNKNHRGNRLHSEFPITWCGSHISVSKGNNLAVCLYYFLSYLPISFIGSSTYQYKTFLMQHLSYF